MVEVVIVVIIIAMLAAIVLPRTSRAVAGTNDAACASNLKELRRALELYQAEHSVYPDADHITDQLTRYSDADGNTSPTKDGTFGFGPYIKAIPALPVGARKGSDGISTTAGSGVGWVYDPATGAITPNTASEVDGAGKLYTNY